MQKKDEHQQTAKEGEPAPAGQIAELTPLEYIRVVNFHLMKDNPRDAYAVLRTAIVVHPEDPHILSFYGSLQAIVDKKYRTGIENCSKAIVLFKKKSALNVRLERYAMFYLNLGKANLAGGKKKDAIAAFQKGLQYDHKNSALLKQMEALGTRKKPLVSFLERSNPINKYLGKMRHQEKKKDAGRAAKSRA